MIEMDRYEENEEQRTLDEQQPALQSRWLRFRAILKRYHILKLFVAMILTVVMVFCSYFIYFAKTADVSNLKADLSQPTQVYDAKGELAGSLSISKGTYVSIESISQAVKDAVLSTEDKRFYSHVGMDPIGIMRSLVGFVTSGNITGGGSTITQQLAKNTFLTQDQTLMRKAKELFLSFEIEREYEKDEILEMYLNNAYFGNGVYGIENASQFYFGKSAAQLGINEAAVLAGSLKSPSVYNPIDHMEKTIQRRATVLDLMVANGKLDSEQAEKIKSEPIHVVGVYADSQQYQYPYYFNAVIDEIVEQYGLSEDDILNKGYKIYTGLNQQMQQEIEATFKKTTFFPEAEDGTRAQSATIVLDSHTGDVLATVGGRVEDEYVFRGYHRATQMRRQPASTFKPIAVYTAALEKGYTPDSILKDEKASYGSDGYTPENFNHTYAGTVTMTHALTYSLNAPAVWLLDQIGLQTGIDKIQQFGIPLAQEDYYLGVALGGLTKGVSPLQMASAYTAFANRGMRVQARFVTKIVDATGQVIVDNTAIRSNRVTSETIANEMTSMLLTVFTPSGSGAAAIPSGYTIAGKTGTSEGDSEGLSRDQWIIGYTPDIVVATWMGFDDATYKLKGTSSTTTAPLFKAEMERILPYTNETAFSVSAKTISDTTSSGTGQSLSDVWKDVQKMGETLWEDSKRAIQQMGDWLKQWLPGN